MKCSHLRWFAFALFAACLFAGFQTGAAADDPKDPPTEKKTDDKKVDDDKKAKADEAAKKADDLRKEAARRAEEQKKKNEDAQKEAAKRAEEQKKKIEEQKKKFEEEAAKRKADQEEQKKRAEAAKKLDDLPKSKDGFALLFNGKDFTNWRSNADSRTYFDGKTEVIDKHYVADKDLLVLDAGETKGVIHGLQSVKELNKLVQIRFEFRAIDEGNASFNFGGHAVRLRDYTKMPKGAPPSKLKNFKSGEWNEIEITLQPGAFRADIDRKPVTDKDVFELSYKDGKPEVKLNGKVVDVNSVHLDRNPPLAVVTCNGEELSRGNMPGIFGQGFRAHVGFQAERGKVEVRNVRVKELN